MGKGKNIIHLQPQPSVSTVLWTFIFKVNCVLKNVSSCLFHLLTHFSNCCFYHALVDMLNIHFSSINLQKIFLEICHLISSLFFFLGFEMSNKYTRNHGPHIFLIFDLWYLFHGVMGSTYIRDTKGLEYLSNL